MLSGPVKCASLCERNGGSSHVNRISMLRQQHIYVQVARARAFENRGPLEFAKSRHSIANSLLTPSVLCQLRLSTSPFLFFSFFFLPSFLYVRKFRGNERFRFQRDELNGRLNVFIEKSKSVGYLDRKSVETKLD